MSWKSRKQFLKAQKLLEANDLTGAEQIFSEVIERDQKSAEAFLHRAYIRTRLNKLDEALSDADTGIHLRPENGVMYMIRGEIQLEKKNYREAFDSLQKACGLEKDNGRAFFHLGRATLGLSRKAEAADYFETALQFERDYCLAQSMAENYACN
ncbi:MAG: hypothetical protein JWQ35_2000 [Bacteriovoracaceae bacterium]|nr:hypothetical protein [Bacteriovoracaceae bacterium]